MKPHTSLALNTFPSFHLSLIYWREMWGALHNREAESVQAERWEEIGSKHYPSLQGVSGGETVFLRGKLFLRARASLLPVLGGETQAGLVVPVELGSLFLLVSGAAAGLPACSLQAVSLCPFQPRERTPACGLTPQSGLIAGRWPSCREWSFSSLEQ